MAKKKNSDVGQRAWNLLCLVLLCARKGGVFKRRLTVELRLLPKFLKGLGRNNEQMISRHYKEREFSFNETPIFHLKMHHRPAASMRFLLPCISTQEVLDFDYVCSVDDYDDDDARKSYSSMGSEIDEEVEKCGYEGCDEKDEGIDSKAEKFIEKFYEQMRLRDRFHIWSILKKLTEALKVRFSINMHLCRVSTFF